MLDAVNAVKSSYKFSFDCCQVDFHFNNFVRDILSFHLYTKNYYHRKIHDPHFRNLLYLQVAVIDGGRLKVKYTSCDTVSGIYTIGAILQDYNFFGRKKHTHTHTHTYTPTHIHTHTYTHTHIHTHTHTYIHTHIYIHTHTYIHTHIHT